ncbi:MAG: hypothetical protein RL354_1626, partial [Planctomycetota bacterium]
MPAVHAVQTEVSPGWLINARSGAVAAAQQRFDVRERDHLLRSCIEVL